MIPRLPESFAVIAPTRAACWQDRLAFPAALTWLLREARTEAGRLQRLHDRAADRFALRHALAGLFGAADLPLADAETDLHLLRNSLGQPYVAWSGAVQTWAEQHRFFSHHLHVSNSHDGPNHLLFVGYHADLVGVGIDVVHLPRLRRAGKGSDYLRRFARQFMGAEEGAIFQAQEFADEEALRLHVAAHFSLMESASKACGTGLKLGIGLGTAQSLPPRTLGALQVEPEVRLWLGEPAQARLAQLGVGRAEGFWGTDGECLISLVLLWREISDKV